MVRRQLGAMPPNLKETSMSAIEPPPFNNSAISPYSTSPLANAALRAPSAPP
jgi:hypothetical protein